MRMICRVWTFMSFWRYGIYRRLY